ncbi:uncharacterized protein [Argopecten irradians]|uniref:uncharacterized protein n=1 Tax=Argopecten irradians TaxID=31199 RepID=UPI003718D9E3
MAAKRETRREDINEEVISKHNDLVYHLSVQIVEDDFQSLIDLFKDCPRAPKDLINITTVHELFEKLEKNENISIGHYEYFTERLEKVNKKLASYVRREEQEIRDILNAGLSPAKRLRTEQECIQQLNSGGPPVSDQTAGSSSHTPKVSFTEIHSDLLPMIETTISMIKTEKEKEIQFMPTKAYHDAQEKLRKNRVLVIKGNTGTAKRLLHFNLIHCC